MADHGVVGLHPACLEYLYSRLDLVIENPGGAYDDIVNFTKVVKATVRKAEEDGTLDKAWTLVHDACKDFSEAENFLKESTALLPHANGDWRVIDRMLSDYGAPAGTFSSAEEFLTTEPPKGYKKCYNTVWYYLHSRETWSKPTPDSPIFKEGDQEHISNLEAFWASMWNVNASATFLKLLDTGAPEYQKHDNLQRVVTGGYKVVKTLLDRNGLFSITRTDVGSDQIWIPEDFDHKSFMAGEPDSDKAVKEGKAADEEKVVNENEVIDQDKVLLLNSDVATLRKMQHLVKLTGQPTIVAALIIKELFTKESILTLTEDGFIDVVTSLPHAPVSSGLAQRIYQTLGAPDHDAVVVPEPAEPFKIARNRDLTDPANPAALISLDPNLGPKSSHPQHATVKELVGGGDLITLDDGLTTVTSPSAYFVDLLEFLKHTTATHEGLDGQLTQVVLFDLLVARRPDLPYLQLSIENTSIAMPYLDLVNEVMTQVIFAKDPSSESPPIYYDTQFGQTSKDLLARPLHIDYNVYRLISGTVPIGSLPYDPQLHRMRLLLRAMGTSLLDLMLKFPSTEKHLGLEPPLTDDRERLIHTEFLQISDQEARLIISSQTPGPETVKKFWGFPYSTTQIVMLEKLSLVEDEVLPRASIELSDLAQILKTNYINPGVMRENGNFDEDTNMNPGPLVIIDAAYDDGPPGLLSNMRLLRRDSTSPTWAQLQKLMIFIRVWKHINALPNSGDWTIDNLDRALSLFPDPSRIKFDLVLSEIDCVSQISALTGLDISRVLVLFGNLSMRLYREIFVRHDLAARDHVFEWNENTGMYLGDDSIKVADHLSVLFAALRISSREFALILAYLGTGTDEVLNFTTLSAYLRTIFIRDAFGIGLGDLGTLDQFRRVFGTPTNTPRDFLRALKKWQRLTTGDFSVGECIFIATGQDPDKLGPDPKLVISMTGMLGSKHSLIDSQYPDIIDNGEATAESVLRYASPLFGSQSSKEIVSFLDGKRVVRIPIDPSAIPASFEDTKKLKVSRQDGLLIATGILTDTELRDALTQGRQPGWQKALDSIRNLAQDFYRNTMGDMLSESPDALVLENFFLQGDDDNSAQLKRAKFLETFIPLLRQRLIGKSVQEFVGSGVLQGMAPEVIRMILAKSPPDPQTPVAILEQTIEEKLMAIRSDVYDPSEAFEGHLIPTATDSYRFVADAGPGSNLSVTIDGTTYALKPQFDQSQFLITDAVTLTGSQIYDFSATSGIQGLRWRALQNHLQQTVPIDALIKSNTSEDLMTNLTWLTRFRMLIDRLHLDSREVEALDTRVSWEFIDYMMSYIDLRAYIVSQQEKTTTSAVAQKLLSVFPLRIDPNNAPRYSAAEIANATGWSQEDIRPYASFTPTDKVTWRGVLQIKSQISIIKSLGVLVGDVYRWVSGRATDTFDDRWEKADELALLYNNSPRMSHAQWEETAATSVYDQLRDSHRKALVAFLLQQSWLKDVSDADALFEYLLIDTQMGAGLETSRTKQAISTVQLFVQRCLLGLEEKGTLRITNVESFIQKWNWMSKYRVWEANRKVFIFPENWIDPAFRDDKSPAFEAFESNLLKSPITQEHITRAVLDYVHDAYEVRSLFIEATYTKRGPIVDNNPGPIEQIHYFGRTMSAPYTFYHRIFAQTAGTWTSWRKIDTQISVVETRPDGSRLDRPGVFIIPYEFQGRLFLILPEFQLKNRQYHGGQSGFTTTTDRNTTTVNPPTSSNPVEKDWQIKLAWTEFRNNKWSPKILCPSIVEYGSFTPLSEFRFLVGLPTEILDSTDQSIRTDLTNKNGNETFSVWVDRAVGYWGNHVGAFVWRNGAFESFGSRDEPLGFGDNGPFKYTYFQKKDKEYPIAMLGVIETSFLCRNYTVGSISYEKDTTPLKSPDVTDTRTLNADYQYQFRNVLAPKLMPMLDTKSVFGEIAEFGADIGTLEVATERLEVFGGTRNGQGVPSFPHELRTPVAIYSWELGFHIPAMIMERAMAAQQFDIALEYARYIFDPRPTGSQPSYWKWPPFSEFNPASSTVADKTTIEEWKLNPFQPHVIARGRPLAYKKWVVMKYMEILIAYGDSYFRQNTLETVPLAIQLYIEAAHIFGPRAQKAPEIGRTQTDRFGNLEFHTFDALSNVKVEMEYIFPFVATKASIYAETIFPLGTASSEYFKYYSNPKMIELRALIDDRLMKIRNSMDINGVKRKLALFEPAMDPGALVAAMARSGASSLSSILSGMDSPMPNCRLRYILPTALSICHELKHLSLRYLRIKERGDAEELAALKASQHTSVQRILAEMQSMEIEVAKKQLEVAKDDIEAPRMRLKYYRQLLGMSDLDSLQETPQMIQQPSESDDLRRTPLDKREQDYSLAATVVTGVAQGLTGISGLTFLLPAFKEMIQPFGVGAEVEFGPKQVGKSIESAAKVLEMAAKVCEYEAETAKRAGELMRRRQENTLEANEAVYEIKNMQLKIEAEEQKLAAAEQKLESQRRYVEHALEVEEFLRSKYTNKELYTWLDSTYKNFHYQSYNLAYDIAKRAEKAYHFETGDGSVNFIKYGYWDDSHNGLGCAEGLYLDLKKLEQAQLTSRPYDFEIVKNVSLREMAPLQLVTLREAGVAEFAIPELAYDLDFPGHYFRRIKTVSVTVLCTVAPNTGVCCTLKLLENKYRIKSNVRNASQYAQQDPDAFRSDKIPVESIAVSSGVSDSGTFQLDFEGEHFLPFEGAGAISRWSLEFPTNFRHFNYETIQDVVLEVKYTSKGAGGTLRTSAVAAAETALKDASKGGLIALLDLRNDFPDEWQAFVAGQDGNHILNLDKLKSKLPFFAQIKKSLSSKVFLLTTNTTVEGSELKLSSGQVPGREFSGGSSDQGLRRFDADFQSEIAAGWALTYSYSGPRQPLEMMWMVVQYHLS